MAWSPMSRGRARHDAADADIDRRLGHGVGVQAAGVVETGGAVLDRFDDEPAQRAEVGLLGGQRRFVGVEPLVEQGEDVDIVADAVGEVLVGVVVPVDEPGNRDHAAGVDHVRRIVGCAHRFGRTHRDDAVAGDGDGAVGVDPPIAVHRHDIGMGDDQIGHGCLSRAPRIRARAFLSRSCGSRAAEASMALDLRCRGKD